MGIGGIIGSMGAISYDIVSEDKTKDGIDSAKSGFKSLMVEIGLVTAAVAESAYVIKGAADHVADYADEMSDLSIVTGISTTRLEEMKFIAAGATADFNALQANMIMVGRRMEEVGSNKKLTEAFDKLGISVRDANGNLRSQDEIFPLIIERLAQIENVSDRAAIAGTIFGRNYADAMKIAGEGTERIRELREEAHKLGVVMGPEAVAEASRFKGEMMVLNEAPNLGCDLGPIPAHDQGLADGPVHEGQHRG